MNSQEHLNEYYPVFSPLFPCINVQNMLHNEVFVK